MGRYIHLKGGRAKEMNIRRGRGLRIDALCLINMKPLEDRTPKVIYERLCKVVDDVFDGVYAPGYYIASKRLGDDGLYRFHLIPITARSVREYVSLFENPRVGILDLANAVDLIEDAQKKECVCNILDEMRQTMAYAASDDDDFGEFVFTTNVE